MTAAVRPPRELYDQTAELWARDEPVSLSDFTARPAVLGMCEPVAGADVLDLGCGEGYCARRLAAAGARRVLGIDVSERMIELARARPGEPMWSLEYAVGDATALGHLPDARFDVVVAVFLYNYLDLARTTASFCEVARVLRPGGRFVLAVPHPMFAFAGRPPAPPFAFDAGAADYFTARGATLPGRIWRRDGAALEVQMCHKTMEDYFGALRDAGFRALPAVRELAVTPELVATDPAFFGPVAGVPLHLALRVER